MHGGGIGYNRVDWTVVGEPTDSRLVLSYRSWDGQQVGAAAGSAAAGSRQWA